MKLPMYSYTMIMLPDMILYHVRLDRTYNLSSPLTPNIGGKLIKVPHTNSL